MPSQITRFSFMFPKLWNITLLSNQTFDASVAITCTPRQESGWLQKGQHIVLNTQPSSLHQTPCSRAPSTVALKSCLSIDETSQIKIGIRGDPLTADGCSIFFQREAKWIFDRGVIEHIMYKLFSGRPNGFLQSEQKICTLIWVIWSEDALDELQFSTVGIWSTMDLPNLLPGKLVS